MVLRICITANLNRKAPFIASIFTKIKLNKIHFFNKA